MDENDLISRSEAVRAVMCFDDDGSIRDAIYNLPAVDPEKLRPKGRWKVDKSHNGEPYCSL